MAYNHENVYFGSFKEPILPASDKNALPLHSNFPYLNTLHNNTISSATFRNPSPNIMFGSFSENYPIPNQIPIVAPFPNQSPSQNMAFAPFSVGQQNFEGSSMSVSDLTITSVHTLQQNNVAGIDTLIPHARSDGDLITPCPRMKQNNHPQFNGSPKIMTEMNRTRTTSNENHNGNGETINRSRKRSRSGDRVNWSSSGSQRKKRIRFRFDFWTDEEKIIMHQEIPKCFASPILDTCKQIAILLPKKSVRDVAMYIKSLIKQGMVEDIWDWEDPSPRTDLRDYKFYLPDDPNDPDLVNIRNMFIA